MSQENLKPMATPFKALQRIEACKKAKSETLGLSKLDLTEIPVELADLFWLTELYLDSNQITEIKGLENLTKLNKLSLYRNQISEIKGLETLANLTELYLSSNQVSEIKGLENLIDLTILYLSGNRISEIKGLENLTNLTVLYLDNNQISEIKGLETLTKLNRLDLYNNQISEIKGLETLTKLIRLGLYNNQISEIKGLETLTKLNRLDLYNNQISEIKDLEKLTNLIELYLYNNQISEIKGLEKLTNLAGLALDNNQISEIKGLEKLTNLIELYLFSNRISEIKGLENLTKLTKLQIHKNPFGEKYQLNLEEGYEADHLLIIQNLLQREKEAELKKVSLPAKILLLGNHACGKSSLMHYLKTGDLGFSSGSTHVLKIEAYPPGTSSLPRALFFDFGGQDYYHGIYRVFLSVSAGNVLLFAPEKNRNETVPDSNDIPTQNFSLSYWLGQKQLFHSQSPLILVQTYASASAPAEYAAIGALGDFRSFAHVSLAERSANLKNN